MELRTDHYFLDDVEYFITTLSPYSLTIFSGTVFPQDDFNPKKDAEALSAAIKKKDNKTIISILCRRSNEQRQQIKSAYETIFATELTAELSKKLGGDFGTLISVLLYFPSEYDARELKDAMKGIGAKKEVLIEILSTRTNKEIEEIKAFYQKLFTKTLAADIMAETTGQLNSVLTNLLKAEREEDIHLDHKEASIEAEKLKNADKKGWETFFAEKATVESFIQLQAIFMEYKKITGKDIEEIVRKTFSGENEECHIALVKVAKNRAAYFAEWAQKAVKGLGTDEKRLNRIIIGRCEKDLKQVKEEYERLYKTTLVAAVKDDTSGDYRDALVSLITGIWV